MPRRGREQDHPPRASALNQMGDLAERRCVEAVGRLVQNEQPWGSNQAAARATAPWPSDRLPNAGGQTPKAQAPDLFGVEAANAFERLDHGSTPTPQVFGKSACSGA